MAVKRKKEPILTDEEKQEISLQSGLRDLIRAMDLIPEPTYHFNIGDKVLIGNLQNVTIEAIEENGKIYKINYSHTDTNYGHPITTHNHKMYVKWIDIRRYQENASEELIKNQDLRLYYSQRTMLDLFSKAYHFGIDFNPEYQRDYVWSMEDKIILIDSIFNTIDIGKIVFIKNFNNELPYEILDGKQRVRAILDFYEDRFKYKGKYFSDLSIREQHFFREYTISIAELESMTDEQKLRYFIKLNRCGRVMDESQLAKVEKMLENIQNQ